MCARLWRDEGSTLTWLATPPLIQFLEKQESAQAVSPGLERASSVVQRTHAAFGEALHFQGEQWDTHKGSMQSVLGVGTACARTGYPGNQTNCVRLAGVADQEQRGAGCRPQRHCSGSYRECPRSASQVRFHMEGSKGTAAAIHSPEQQRMGSSAPACGSKISDGTWEASTGGLQPGASSRSEAHTLGRRLRAAGVGLEDRQDILAQERSDDDALQCGGTRQPRGGRESGIELTRNSHGNRTEIGGVSA